MKLVLPVKIRFLQPRVPADKSGLTWSYAVNYNEATMEGLIGRWRGPFFVLSVLGTGHMTRAE